MNYFDSLQKLFYPDTKKAIPKKTGNGVGFTIIELLFAMSISIVVVIVLLTVSVNGLKYVRGIKERERLQAEADYVINKMAYSIRQAKQFELPSSSEIHVILRDSTEEIFKKEGDKINLNGQSIIGDATKAADLNFVLKDKSVKVNFRLNQGTADILFKTTLAQRNF